MFGDLKCRSHRINMYNKMFTKILRLLHSAVYKYKQKSNEINKVRFLLAGKYRRLSSKNCVTGKFRPSKNDNIHVFKRYTVDDVLKKKVAVSCVWIFTAR